MKNLPFTRGTSDPNTHGRFYSSPSKIYPPLPLQRKQPSYAYVYAHFLGKQLERKTRAGFNCIWVGGRQQPRQGQKRSNVKSSSLPGDPQTCLPYGQRTYAVLYVNVLYKNSTIKISACPHNILAYRMQVRYLHTSLGPIRYSPAKGKKNNIQSTTVSKINTIHFIQLSIKYRITKQK